MEHHLAMEQYYKTEPNPDQEALKTLAAQLGLEVERVETWFNIRNQEKSKHCRPQVGGWPKPKRSMSVSLSFFRYHSSHCCKSEGCKMRPDHSCEICNLKHPKKSYQDAELESSQPTPVEAFQRLSVSDSTPGDPDADDEEKQDGDEDPDAGQGMEMD